MIIWTKLLSYPQKTKVISMVIRILYTVSTTKFNKKGRKNAKKDHY